MRKSLLLFFILTSALGSLVFKVSSLKNGFNLEKPKKKHAIRDLGEDSTSATPLGLALADGVTKCPFSSKFVSHTLVNTLAALHINPAQYFKNAQFSDKDYRKIVLGNINHQLQEFWQTIQGEYDSFLQAGNLSEDDFPLDNFGTSSTLVSAIIDPAATHDNLKIFQKGDSLIAIFRLVPSESHGTLHYQLQFLSPELQREFGKPHQFVGISDVPPNFKDDAVFTETVQDGDIVLLGSDGLFDNVHSSVLVFCLNFWVQRIIEGNLNAADPRSVFDEFGDMLLEKLAKESQDIKDSMDSFYSPQVYEELMSAIADGRLQLVDSDVYLKLVQENEIQGNSHAAGMNPFLFQTRGAWSHKFDIEEENESANDPNADFDFDGHGVPEEHDGIHPVSNYKTYQVRNQDKINHYPQKKYRLLSQQARLKKFTQKPAGEDLDYEVSGIHSGRASMFKSQAKPSMPDLLKSKRPGPSTNLLKSNIAAARLESRRPDAHFTSQNLIQSDVHKDNIYDPSVHIYDDTLANKNDFEAFLAHIDGRDIVYQQLGKQSEMPLVSGRVELFMSRRYSFKPTEITKFKKEYDLSSFALAVAELAYKLSSAHQWYPSPFWLNALKWGIPDPEALGKPDDISLIPALVLSNPQNVKIMTIPEGYKEIGYLDTENREILVASVWSFMSNGVPNGASGSEENRDRRRLGKVHNIRI